ncbi:MAG: acetate/propionate family kinase [Bacteroidetes bacterium]|nr:acetate/propionate family kinase [Bacteroidota bacterium]MBU1372674.1 acetate/propionate family kinase [Bacteroidota bacterium]MBU1484870.1 acetate/propionate family kinase [Bacteroidota bacterium]MBU1761565.1 acetate/propionate family kinase [Bacteroidota bacterium]MBU2046405.1 acetate/propionate family kinase [Bacteroidota bacterium]
MKSVKQHILIINGGSSSIKFALYNTNKKLKNIISGQISRIGLDNPEFTVTERLNPDQNQIKIKATNFKEAAESLMEWLQEQKYVEGIVGIGHRIVHGMEHALPKIIDDNLLQELHKIMEYDPDHLPAEIEMIALFKKQFPQVIQVACFDTSFHATMPKYARMFAIPKKYYTEGVKRYGFHGISYSYQMKELKKQNRAEANGKVILAHLGNGASLAAVKKGKCLDTSMGFTPTGGVVMSTRSGDLDPGVAWYLMQKGLDAKEFNELINHQSGLLGISGYSSNMQDLLEHEKSNKDVALTIEIFCYQIRKTIGAYTATLGGLNVLVFSGGIGENAPSIRKRICEGFNYLGIELDARKNRKSEKIISTKNSKVKVYVIPTDEEIMIATVTKKLHDKSQKSNLSP